jgi:protein phosphatase
VVTRALGSDPAPEPDVWVFPPTPGERFLICSDGLQELGEAEVAAVLGTGADPQAVADELVRRTKAYGGRDDVSVIVVDNPGVADEPMADTSPRAGRAG